MNANSLTSKYKVVSKYFTGNTVMDESLTDFQEKKSFKGPKTVKASAPKPKVKKAVKRIKGQKDIRTALKSNKNELLAYSKNFDEVCKKSGIDVDPEQLQLAIALSKSLQPSESGESPSTSSLTTQQRTGLIRTTLKEYGFKVPEVKPSKKIYKKRKSYKLLLTTHEQKQQLISDRYSQIIFEQNNSKRTSDDKDLDVSDLFIYNMATNIEYKDIKDDDVFYVKNLVDKSPNSMGCLLKKWSNIPGRPLSPAQEKSEIIFSEIECSQDEMDIVLSGSLKFSKELLKRRNLSKRKSADYTIIDKVHQDSIPVITQEHNNKKSSPVLVTANNGSDRSENHKETVHITEQCIDNDSLPDVITVGSGDDNLKAKNYPIEVTDIQHKQSLTVPQPSRSLSPDLFEDDEDTIVEINSEIAKEIPVNLVFNVIKETSDVMDLTECVNITSQIWINKSRNFKPLSHLSQEVNITKRKSNDFMEMTECVGVSSQVILERIDEHIDLTAYNYERVTEKNSICVDNVEHMDLTQSSNSSTDTLPFVHISGKNPVPDKSLDDTIILNDNDYVEMKATIMSTEICDADTNSLNVFNDIIQNRDLGSEARAVYDNNVEICEVEAVEDDNLAAAVDLTQTLVTIETEVGFAPNNINHQVNNSGLGKKDDVSVDYDEALENINSMSYYANDTNLEESNEENILSNNSKHLEVIELSDNEIDSPNKNNKYDFSRISEIDNLQSSNPRNTINSVPNGSVMSESLPMVDIKGKDSPVKPGPPFRDFLDQINDRSLITNDKRNKLQTPIKGADSHVDMQTPKQTEYIVKTDNVTPMLDYAGMSSPERNRELEKYGLKPFKRKRAIQLLTHLYNQTHPYVESTEELPLPSKRRKHECLSQPSSSKAPQTSSKSPRKVLKSPRKKSASPQAVEHSGSPNVSDKENMFMVTSEVPAIRHIECDAEDWVFQKREKVKLHTCRVPLHIAFHNYVSCRSGLLEAILRYEPVNIDAVHKELAASGHRYDPKDLLKFMDKKCITVKTADNVKNKNRY